MLHSAMGDSVVAFRHVIKFSEENKEKKINLIYNRLIDQFMRYWLWPNNINLMPLNQIFHDIDNIHSFPYKCEEDAISMSFNNNEENAHDFRPFFIYTQHEPIKHNNLQGIIPDRPSFLFGLGDYVVIQPISTDYTHRYMQDELKTYESFLFELIEQIHMHTRYSIAIVGTRADADKLPNLKVKQSVNRFFNLIGHLSVEGYCDAIKHSSVVLGFNSSAVNIGGYILGKPIASWTLWDRGCEYFNDFIDVEGSLANNECRPWQKEMNYYIDFLKNVTENEG